MATAGLAVVIRKYGILMEHHEMGRAISADNVKLKRAYDRKDVGDGTRILIDRLWPRGITKDEASIDEWIRDVAPTAKLRSWFGHRPDRWAEFRRRYRLELGDRGAALRKLRDHARRGPITLVYAARDQMHTHALVLRSVLLGRAEP